MLTIDASVWVSAISPAEVGSASSRALLSQIADARTRVIVPTLLAVEVAAAVSRTRKDAALAKSMAEALTSLPYMEWISLDAVVSDRAIDLAAEHGLRGADAIYAAVAVMNGCTLVSLDGEHLTRLRSTVSVASPAESLARMKS